MLIKAKNYIFQHLILTNNVAIVLEIQLYFPLNNTQNVLPLASLNRVKIIIFLHNLWCQTKFPVVPNPWAKNVFPVNLSELQAPSTDSIVQNNYPGARKSSQ